MGADVSDLPAGFVLDQPQASRPAGLPQGFVLDQPKPKRVLGSFLPISSDEKGEDVRFDSDAGIVGALKRGFTAPGDVMSGKLDPMSPEGLARARETAGMLLPRPVVPAPARLVPGMKAFRKQEIEAPTAEALKEAADQGYKAARGLGVDYSSQSAKSLSEGIQRSLEADGVLAELSPKTFAILRRLQEPPDGSVASLDGLVAVRRALQNAAGDFTNKTEQMAATRAIRELDRFIESAAPGSVVAGDAAAASQLIKDARGNTAAAKRSEAVSNLEERAQLRSESTNSGNNVASTIRQRVVSLLDKPKETRGYTEQELEMMRQIARGTPLSNFTRNWGNRLGGGGGLGAAVTSGLSASAAGMATGNPYLSGAAAFALPALGYGLKKASTALTKRQIESLDDALRMRSPLYQHMQREAPTVPLNPIMEAALLRSLLLSAPEQQ